MSAYLRFDGHTLWDATEQWPNYVLSAEKDINGRTHIIEPLGDRMMNIYRATKAENRVYTAVVKIAVRPGYMPLTLTELKAQWEAWHSVVGGLRVLERATETGQVLRLDAVPETPQWGDEGPTWAQVTQTYTAANPWWRETAQDAEAGNFNGTTPVTLTCNNLGDLPTWVELHIEGPVTTPKIELVNEWWIEFDLDLEVGEELVIVCQTPAEAWFIPTSGPDVKVPGYRIPGSSFRKAKLEPGANDLILSAAAGNGPCTAFWYVLYEALQ